MKRPGEITVNREKALAWRQRSRQALSRKVRLKAKRHPEKNPVRVAVYERDGHRCQLADFACWGPLTPHHLRKGSAVGAYTEANLTTLCAWHNNDVENRPDVYRDTVLPDGRSVVVRPGHPEWDALSKRAAQEGESPLDLLPEGGTHDL